MKTLFLIFTLLTHSFAFAAPNEQIKITKKDVTKAITELEKMDDEQYRKTIFDVAENYRKIGQYSVAQQVENFAMENSSREDFIASLKDEMLRSSKFGLMILFVDKLCRGLKTRTSVAMCIFTIASFTSLTLEGEKASDF